MTPAGGETDDEREAKAARLAFERGRETARIDGILSTLQVDVRELRNTSGIGAERIGQVERNLEALKVTIDRKDAIATELAKQRDRAEHERHEVEQKGVSTRMFWLGVATVVIMMAALVIGSHQGLG